MKIAVVIGSTREGRQTDRLAKWIAKNVEHKADVELLDLHDYPMPFLNEAISPRYNPERKPDAETKKWLEKVAEFDGYLFVTPEYNRSTSAVLKNAIDVLAYEIEDKPVALAAHGVSGGAQAIASLRMALPGVGAITVPQALFFSDMVAKAFDDNDELMPELRDNPYGPQTQLNAVIEKLVWYTQKLQK
jgi:NAD(P)H-dependent FMN reductase